MGPVGKSAVVITIGRDLNEQTFKTLVKNYHWTMPSALDFGNATTKLYNIPSEESLVGVVIDPNGKIVETKGWNWVYSGGPGQGRKVIEYELKKTLDAAQGEAIPERAKPIAELLRHGLYGQALALAKKLPDKPADVAAYRDRMIVQLEDLKKSRFDQIESLASQDAGKFAALMAIECFLKAFPSEKESEKVKAIGAKLKNDAALKREYQARSLFFKAADLSSDKKTEGSAIDLWKALRTEFADTFYGQLAAKAD